VDVSRPSTADRKKFDLQLSVAVQDEDRLAGLLSERKMERAAFLELKAESHQWERTGNICVELYHEGKPSGLLATTADFWFHELKPYGCYFVFPVARLKQLVLRNGKHRIRENAGDGGRSTVALVSLRELLS